MSMFLLLINYMIQAFLFYLKGLDGSIAILGLLVLIGAFVTLRLDKIIKLLEKDNTED